MQQPQNINLNLLRQFRFERVLDDDSLIHSLHVLGTLPRATKDGEIHLPAIISLQRTHISPDIAHDLVQSLLYKIDPIEDNDIYHWLFAWIDRESGLPDVKVNMIFPATEVHIRKYSKQNLIMVTETPQLYKTIVQPYIAAFPRSRFEWVYNILSHEVESHKILYEDPSPDTGFILLPDMKWDLKTVSALYLMAITHAPSIATLRDLQKRHIPMLKSIRREAGRVARERWGLNGEHSLRFYIHYQPSYYHFHVHIVNSNFIGFKGLSAGQAHILEDIISLLELSPSEGPTLLEQINLTYQLGEQHGLYLPMLAAQGV